MPEYVCKYGCCTVAYEIVNENGAVFQYEITYNGRRYDGMTGLQQDLRVTRDTLGKRLRGGLCLVHQERRKRGSPAQKKICKVEGCASAVWRNSYCRDCLEEMWRIKNSSVGADPLAAQFLALRF